MFRSAPTLKTLWFINKIKDQRVNSFWWGFALEKVYLSINTIFSKLWAAYKHTSCWLLFPVYCLPFSKKCFKTKSCLVWLCHLTDNWENSLFIRPMWNFGRIMVWRPSVRPSVSHIMSAQYLEKFVDDSHW